MPRVRLLRSLVCPSPSGTAEIWHLYAESRGQINLVILFLHEDLTDLFSHCEFAENFTLADPVAVVSYGFIFVV